MAGRPNKEGLDYFSLDCHMDEKIELIEAEFGLKGFAVIVKLLQRIYGEHGYYCEWNEDISLLFTRKTLSLGDDNNLINEIINASIRRNIFSSELYHKYRILTSQGIQKRFLEAVSRRDKVELKKEYLLIDVGKNTINVVTNSINVCRNTINADTNTQSKVKESKEDIKKNSRFVPPTLEEVQAYCKERSNTVDAEQFINHYTANGWVQGKGKPIKDWKACVRTWERNGFNKPTQPKQNRFNQFPQREYTDKDYAELEKKLLQKSGGIN